MLHKDKVAILTKRTGKRDFESRTIAENKCLKPSKAAQPKVVKGNQSSPNAVKITPKTAKAVKNVQSGQKQPKPAQKQTKAHKKWPKVANGG